MTTPNTTKTAPSTTTCQACGDTVSRTYFDQAWFSDRSGDVCFGMADLHRMHQVDVTIPAVRATYNARVAS